MWLLLQGMVARVIESESQETHDEGNLLQRARRFDEAALTRIFHTYHDAIYRYLYHRLGEAQTAQDLASDVFRRFLQALRDGRGPTRHLRAWLYRVAHNLVVDELRRRTHRDHESLDGKLAETLRADQQSLDDLAWNALTSERVRHALQRLTEDQRQVVILKYLQGMTNAEVAHITGKTIGAVKALQHRGFDTLRAELTRTQRPRLAAPGAARPAAPSPGR